MRCRPGRVNRRVPGRRVLFHSCPFRGQTEEVFRLGALPLTASRIVDSRRGANSRLSGSLASAMILGVSVSRLTPSSSLAKDATLSRSRSRVRIPPGSPLKIPTLLGILARLRWHARQRECRRISPNPLGMATEVATDIVAPRCPRPPGSRSRPEESCFLWGRGHGHPLSLPVSHGKGGTRSESLGLRFPARRPKGAAGGDALEIPAESTPAESPVFMRRRDRQICRPLWEHTAESSPSGSPVFMRVAGSRRIAPAPSGI